MKTQLVAAWVFLLAGLVLAGCGHLKPDPACQGDPLTKPCPCMDPRTPACPPVPHDIRKPHPDGGAIQ